MGSVRLEWLFTKGTQQSREEEWRRKSHVSNAKTYLFKQIAGSSGTRWCQQERGYFRVFRCHRPHIVTINRTVFSYSLEGDCKRLLVSLLTLWIIQAVPPLSVEMLISCLAEGQMRRLMQTSDEKTGTRRKKKDTQMEVLEKSNSKQTFHLNNTSRKERGSSFGKHDPNKPLAKQCLKALLFLHPPWPPDCRSKYLERQHDRKKRCCTYIHLHLPLAAISAIQIICQLIKHISNNDAPHASPPPQREMHFSPRCGHFPLF